MDLGRNLPTCSSRRSFLALEGGGALLVAGGRFRPAAGSSTPVLEVYKSPWCSCCSLWVEHMREAGYASTVTDVDELSRMKAHFGVVEDLQSCHTALIDGYVIEGHVPAAEVRRLLRERPAATGLAVPGMPIGSPGMEQGDMREPFAVVLFGPAERTIFARY